MTQTMRDRLIIVMDEYLSDEEIDWTNSGDLLDIILTQLRTPDQVMVDAADLHFAEVNEMIKAHCTRNGLPGLTYDPLPPAFTAMIDAVRGKT